MTMPYVYNYVIYHIYAHITHIIAYAITTSLMYITHLMHTYNTQTLARRQAQHGFVLHSLPVHNQEISILRSEFLKMFQKVMHNQISVTSAIFESRKLRISITQ